MPLTRKVDLRNLNRVKRPSTTTTNLDPITYNDRYPGLDEYNYNKLSSKIDSLGLSGYDREKAMDEAYIQVLPLVQNDIKNSDRRKYINQAKYDVSQIQDPTEQKQANMKLSTVELAQLVKEKYNVDPTANDEAVFNSWMETIPNGEQLLVKYLNSGDKELLYKGGLEKDPNEGKQKLRDNFWDSLWDNIKTKANIPVDNFKKRGKRTFNEASEKIYKNMLKNTLGDGILGKMGINLDNYVDTVTDKTLSPALQQDTLNYQNQINERYQALEQKNMDQDIKNYYDNKGYTKLLGEGDFKGFLYKSMGDAAQNREMPAVIAASVFQPEIGMALMTTDAYARENQEAFENMMNNGATYEQAKQGAVAVGLVNAAVEVTLEKLLGGVETSASSAIRKTLMKNVQEEAAKKGLGRILLEGVGTQLRASGEEGLEEIIQQIVQNAAVKTVNENQELFEGVGQAFEGGFYNPLNLLAGGGNINQNINQNKDVIREQIMEGAYNAGQTTRNITDKVGITNDGSKNTQGAVAVEGSEMVTPQGTETTVDNTVTDINNNGDKATFKEEFYSIDPTLKKNLQNNPYSAEVWQRTQDYIDKNGRPERSNDVAKALIVDVADKVQEKLVEKMEEGGKNGKLYQTIDNAGFTVDLTELKDGLDEMLEGYGIEIEDGKLNFDKTAIDGSEASNIRKIYNWLQDTNAPMSEKEFRTRFKQAMKDMVDFNPNNKDQAGRRRADTPGDKVIKGIMKKANDLAHAQIPELAELDEIYSEWIDIMDEVSDGLVYKDAAKRGIIKDNVYQIIKNLDEPSRRQMVNRLEKLIPGIKDEVNAINQMPKVIDHIYNPSKLQQGLTSEGVKTVGAIGGLPGYLLAKWGGEGIAKLIDSQKSKAWDEVLQETSEEGKAKMAEIQAKIEANQKLSQEQEARLQGLKDRLMEKMATVEKTDAEQSAWESYLADLEQDEVIDMPEEVYDQWEEVTTTPKKKTTKKKTSKKSENKTEAIDKNTQEKIDAYEKEINEIVKPYRMADNSVNLSDFMKDKKAYSKYEKIMDEIRKLQGYMTEDGFFTQKRYDMLNERKERVYGKQVSTWADDEGLDKNQASSKTAKYQVADQINTPEFKKRFGDWENNPENASKIVDDNGMPQKMYHGGSRQYYTFDASKIGENTGNYGYSGDGFYFTESKDYARNYGENVMEVYLDVKKPFHFTRENIKKYAKFFDGVEQGHVALDKEWVLNELKRNDKNSYEFAKMWFEDPQKARDNMTYPYNTKYDPNTIVDLLQETERDETRLPTEFESHYLDEFEGFGKPKYVDDLYSYPSNPEYMLGLGEYSNKDFINAIRKDGYDGIQTLGETVVFEPSQIKSATDNVGTYDRDNPDIRF